MTTINPQTASFSATRSWCVVQTLNNHEKRVEEGLRTRGLETFLPLYRTVRSWKNRVRRQLELPLFPGYLFVRVDPRNTSGPVLQVPSVIRIVGGRSAIAAIREREITQLRAGIAARRLEPHRWLRIGEQVHIVHGPLQGMAGVLVRMKSGLRVVVAVELLLQAVAVEVDAEEIEPSESFEPFSNSIC